MVLEGGGVGVVVVVVVVCKNGSKNKYETMKNEKIILLGIYIVDSKTIKCNK